MYGGQTACRCALESQRRGLMPGRVPVRLGLGFTRTKRYASLWCARTGVRLCEGEDVCARYRGVLSRPRVLEFWGKSWVYGTATRTHTRATPSLLTDVHSWRALFLQPLRSVEEATSSTYKTGCQSGHDKPYAVVTVIQKPEDVCCGPSKPRRRRWSG